MDKNQILQLAARFSDLEFMSYRDQEKMNKKQMDLAKEAVERNCSNIFVAEEDGEFIGYIELTEQTDYFTGEKQGYVSAIAVLPQGEGKGIGKKLMQKAEEWTAEKGIQVLVLDVFQKNERAIKLYEKLGYQQEIVKMTKVL
ncbi:ribosomal protein S18 acetylase RimI-like enzyme [Bacillus horti]|uniref:Ribosomal protein S18 acetylase RimI-like enzyme n=1 Tax=Caldalkalibacillus horti TaxID=77523 RepID=A0ABT9W1K2_9BACI|nr:ribosomal protein S18 acetylase RimI-like enzyme [Bacillus horti]